MSQSVPSSRPTTRSFTKMMLQRKYDLETGDGDVSDGDSGGGLCGR